MKRLVRDLLIFSLFIMLVEASASTVYVSNNTSSSNNTTWLQFPSFLAALTDGAATTIVIADDYYSVGTSFDPYVPAGGGRPTQIERNVTLTASGGPSSMLDLLFVHNAAELCSSCTFTFKDVAVANERRGAGGAVDFFLGQPGSCVVFDNAVRFRPACIAVAESSAAAFANKRSVYFPNPDGTQKLKFQNVTFRDYEYQNQLFFINYTVDDPRRAEEGWGEIGGVAVRSINSSRVCRATVESTCLEQRSSEVCVNTLVDTILAQDAQEQVTQPWWSDLYYITVKITWVLGVACMVLLIVGGLGGVVECFQESVRMTTPSSSEMVFTQVPTSDPGSGKDGAELVEVKQMTRFGFESLTGTRCDTLGAVLATRSYVSSCCCFYLGFQDPSKFD